jgi:hypothetical protein
MLLGHFFRLKGKENGDVFQSLMRFLPKEGYEFKKDLTYIFWNLTERNLFSLFFPSHSSLSRHFLARK